MATWYNVGPFGVVCGPLEYFFPFWYLWTIKNLATLLWHWSSLAIYSIVTSARL
jgi:hypothetical protein